MTDVNYFLVVIDRTGRDVDRRNREKTKSVEVTRERRK